MHAYDVRHGAQRARNSPTLNQDAIARSQLDELLVCVLRQAAPIDGPAVEQ